MDAPPLHRAARPAAIPALHRVDRHAVQDAVSRDAHLAAVIGGTRLPGVVGQRHPGCRFQTCCRLDQ